STWYKDADDDGYSDGTTLTQCDQPAGYKLSGDLIATSGDCDDNDAAINPSLVWYKDSDNDGYSDGTTLTQCDQPTGYKLPGALVSTSGDCNDYNPAINPVAVEICGNGIDENCNGIIDDGDCGTCGNATGLTTTDITSTSATLKWVAGVNPARWKVQFKPRTAGAKWVNVGLPGNLRSVNLTSLASNQIYQWRIRAKCGRNWTTYTAAEFFATLASGVSGTISISEIKQPDAATIKLYPNPAKGQFMLELHLIENVNASATIQVVDMVGKTVYTEKAAVNNGVMQKLISTPSTFAYGVYMVRVLVNDKTYKTQLLNVK
ncbi:MAG: MopE-related protein, partial [Panacibacter sp.]